MLIVDELRLAQLREAVQLGADDFETGRFKSFESAEALSKHLKQLADEVLGMDLQRHQLSFDTKDDSVDIKDDAE